MIKLELQLLYYFLNPHNAKFFSNSAVRDEISLKLLLRIKTFDSLAKYIPQISYLFEI